jgi:hypothetical protein
MTDQERLEEAKATLTELGYGRCAKSLYKDEELMCDPQVWLMEDLDCLLEDAENPGEIKAKWQESRSPRTFVECCTEHGWEIVEHLLNDLDT